MLSGTTRYRECVDLGRSTGAGGVTAIGVGAVGGVGSGADGSGMSLAATAA
jgi:hypothetical protein